MIDTLKTADNLRSAGLPEAHARAIAESLRGAQEEDGLVTTPYLAEQLSPIRTDVVVLKWMCGTNTALLVAVLALLLRQLAQ